MATRLDAIFLEDLAGSRPITEASLRQRSVWLKVLGCLTVPIRSQL